MPTVTIPQPIGPRQAAETLRQQLGDSYTIDSHISGNVLRIKHGTLAFATVRVVSDDTATTFRVHGGEPSRSFRRLHLVRGRWSRGSWTYLSAGVA